MTKRLLCRVVLSPHERDEWEHESDYQWRQWRAGEIADKIASPSARHEATKHLYVEQAWTELVLDQTIDGIKFPVSSQINEMLND